LRLDQLHLSRRLLGIQLRPLHRDHHKIRHRNRIAHHQARRAFEIEGQLAIADSGGDTEFASTYSAYDELDDQEKRRCAALRVVHSLEASQRLVTPDPTPAQVAGWRRQAPREHPLVWTHRTGRKSLVIGATTDHVVGLDHPDLNLDNLFVSPRGESFAVIILDLDKARLHDSPLSGPARRRIAARLMRSARKLDPDGRFLDRAALSILNFA
jgi:hypothetical protein